MKFITLFFLSLLLSLSTSTKIEEENYLSPSSPIEPLTNFLSTLKKSPKTHIISDSLHHDIETYRELSAKLSEQFLNFKEKPELSNEKNEDFNSIFTEISEKITNLPDSSQNLLNVYSEHSKIYEESLRKLKNRLNELDVSLKKSFTGNSQKQAEVASEIQKLKGEIQELESNKKQISGVLEEKKAEFEDFLGNLEGILDKTKDLWAKFKELKVKNDELSNKIAGDRTDLEKLNAEKTKTAEKFNEITRKTQSFAGKNRGLMKQLQFYKEMHAKGIEERKKKTENLKEIQKKIEEIGFQKERSTLELEAKKTEREGLLEELRGKIESKMKKIDEEYEVERGKEKEKKEKIGRLEELAAKIRKEMEKVGVKGDFD